MPQKSRKARTKYKARRNGEVSAAKETIQMRPLPISSRPEVKVKSSIPRGRQADYQRHAIMELKRIALIAAILLTLLIVISLFLR